MQSERHLKVLLATVRCPFYHCHFALSVLSGLRFIPLKPLLDDQDCDFTTLGSLTRLNIMHCAPQRKEPVRQKQHAGVDLMLGLFIMTIRSWDVKSRCAVDQGEF